MSDSQFLVENPTHPGNFVGGEIRDLLSFSVKSASEIRSIAHQALAIFSNAQSNLSPGRAKRLDKAKLRAGLFG